jgi:hypothetical protein
VIYPHCSSCEFHLSKNVEQVVVTVYRIRMVRIAEGAEKFLPHLVDREML